MNNLLKTLTLLLFIVFSANVASAQIKDGEATVTQGSTVIVSIGSAYQSTLNRATSISYTWTAGSSAISIQSKTNKTCTIKGNTAGTAKLNYHCSYYIDGYYRTMDFYYDITIKSSTISVTNLVVSPNTVTLDVGESVKAYATIYPTNATNKAVTWESLNTDVATVDNYGNIKAIAPGSTSILVSSKENYVYQDWVRVTVNAPTHVSSIVLSETEQTLNIGEELTLSATVLPNNAANKNVIWTSNAPEVATVEHGIVSAVSAGECDIVCTSMEDSSISAMCHITVIANEPEVPETIWLSVVLPNGSFAINVTNLESIELKITPDDGFDIHSITLDGVEQDMNYGKTILTLPALTESATLNAVFATPDISTNIDEVEDYEVPLHVSVSGNSISITGMSGNDSVYIYNQNGVLVKYGTGSYFTLDNHGIYILRVGNQSFKFAI